MSRSGQRRAGLAARLALAAGGALVALAGAEVALRLGSRGAPPLPGVQLPEGTVPSATHYLVDPELGYRPRLGTELYGPHGARVNDYPPTPPEGVERLLFVGDSVTFRRQIEHGLERLCGAAGLEWWNAGVEGYNTEQEVEYFLRYNRQIRPDQVILTFHNNDFLVTPVVVAGDGGEFTVILPDRPVGGVRPGWLRRSRLYGAWLGWRMRRQPAEGLDGAVRRAESALERLRDAAAVDGARLSVVLLPILERPSRWSDSERASRRRSLEIFERLAIPVYDLLEPLELALAAGIDPRIEPANTWHPNREIATIFAGYLLERGLLDEVPGRSSCRRPIAWRQLAAGADSSGEAAGDQVSTPSSM